MKTNNKNVETQLQYSYGSNKKAHLVNGKKCAEK